MSRSKPSNKIKTDKSASSGDSASIIPTCIIHCVDNTTDKITLLSDSGDGPGCFKKLQDVCSLRLLQPAGSVHRMADVCSQVPTAYSEERMYGYHRACYQRFTGNLGRMKSSAASTGEGVSGARPRRTPSTEKYIFSAECIFCGKASRRKIKKAGSWTTKPLSKFEYGGGDTILQTAEAKNDYDMI